MFAIAMIVAAVVGVTVSPTWTVKQVRLDTLTDDRGTYYVLEGDPVYFEAIPMADSELDPARLAESGQAPSATEEFVAVDEGTAQPAYFQHIAQPHWGWWSLLPAVVAVMLCWVTKEPITALLGGIIAGALVLGQYDLTGEVLIPQLGTTKAAGILILYLWLLGGLMGVWSRTGAAQAFAELMTRHVVRGPRTAKLVAWFLGVIFFQGGTVSTVLVGTTVKPLADKEQVSHEELAYVVDSTASPIASQIAFNAWPAYVQAFIFVAGVSFLATEADRISFFFQSVPFCFYAIFAVLGTLLLSVEKSPFMGRQMREAIDRARSTGELDAPGAEPLSAKELQSANVPEGYKPNVLEFFLPLGTLIGIAIGTFVIYGAPNVQWAFGGALILASVIALAKGMSLKDLIAGYHDGIKGVVLGSVILLLAVTIGGISQKTGGGIFLVEQLGDTLPYFLLPVLFQMMTMVIAFSHRHKLGHLRRRLPVGHAACLGGGQRAGLVAPRAVHDPVLCRRHGRQRLRRPVLAHLRHHRPEFHVHRLRPDGPREDADSPGQHRRRPRGGMLDRHRLLHSIISWSPSTTARAPVACASSGSAKNWESPTKSQSSTPRPHSATAPGGGA